MTHLTRRKFLTGAAAFAGASSVGSVLYTFLVEPHWLKIERLHLSLRNLPSELDGATLLQLSDWHVGPRVDEDYLISAFQQVSALKPDFVALTGDYISYDSSAESDALARVLKHLPHGRHATCAVLGNHDWGHGWTQRYVADSVASVLADHGVRVLRSEVWESNAGLRFVGMDDFWSPDYGLESVLAKTKDGPATIALSHNPDAADDAAWNGFQGWILSGHTHGGQCKPPFLPPPILPVRNKLYTAGVYDLREGQKMYINRGLGHLLPVRFNVRPEATLFTLETEV